MSRFPWARRVALFGLVGTLGCSRGSDSPAIDSPAIDSPATDAVDPRAGGLQNDTSSGVFVHLFEWRWPDIARECENFLGPHGFTAVQVSPPSEHAILAPNYYPWWQRYQTVSYALTSRSGNREEFADMVQRCRSAGVGIYVDAVLNHMTAQASGTGSAGTKYTKYEYPDLYQASDFHQPACQIATSDYAFSAEHVQSCELVGLADLDTSQEPVQQKLAAYLSELLALGVRGFRLDAAKHVAPDDLAPVDDGSRALRAAHTARGPEQPGAFDVFKAGPDVFSEAHGGRG